MFSGNLQSSLDREVIGQTRATRTLVRAVTMAMSGLDRPDDAAGLFLFVGPTGTGKTHLARELTRLLHGDTRRLAIAECTQLRGRDEWLTLQHQIAPHFCASAGDDENVRAMPPLSILLVEHVERARPEFVQAFVDAVETGSLLLPDGKRGSLRGCLILLTSKMCAREIYEAGKQEFRFSSPNEDLAESEKAGIYQLCSDAVKKSWGPDVLGHVDDLVVFHRLRETHLAPILRQQLRDFSRRLASRRIACELQPEAEQWLVDRAGAFLRDGAWALGKIFRRFVQFPVADLIYSGAVEAESRISIEADQPDRLRFQIGASSGGWDHSDNLSSGVEIPVAWDEPAAR